MLLDHINRIQQRENEGQRLAGNLSRGLLKINFAAGGT
jgi:hypothetical protein